MRPGKLLLLLTLCCTTAHAERLVIYAEDGLPFAYFHDGKVSAPASEFVRELVLRAGYEPDIRLLSWPGIIHLLETSQPIIFYPMARTTEREDKYFWIGSLLQFNNYYLYKKKHRNDIQLHKLDDAKPLRIGVIESDARESYLLSNGFKLARSGAGMVRIPNNKDGMRLLQMERIDLIPLSTSNFESYCKPNCQDYEVAFPLNITMDLQLAANKAVPEDTVKRLRLAYQKLRKDGTYTRIMGNEQPVAKP